MGGWTTSNLQPPTSNTQLKRLRTIPQHWMLRVGCWRLDVYSQLRQPFFNLSRFQHVNVSKRFVG